MQPLRVIAHLANGFASLDPWSPSLDAILAYHMLREHLGSEDFAAQTDDMMSPVEGLPLAVERHGELWWYMCSSPQYLSVAEHIRHFHRRFDAQQAERFLAPQKARVNVTAGPLKAFRLPLRIVVCDRVQWHCIGERADIERLLRTCTHIGAKRGSGHGVVDRWEISHDGMIDIARFMRPLPTEFAEAHHRGGDLMEWGIRPPGRLRENITLCIMPPT